MNYKKADAQTDNFSTLASAFYYSFFKAFRRSYDSVSRHYKFPELKNTEDIGNKTIGFQKTVNSFCKNIIFSFNARIA